MVNEINDWEDMPAKNEIDDWEDISAKDKPFGDKAQGYFEDYIVDQLPQLGATAGGLIGGVGAGLPGGIAGAGAGGYLGKSMQNTYNTYMRPDQAPSKISEYISDPIVSGLESASDEVIGGVLGAGLGKLARPIVEPIAGKVSAFGNTLKGYAENAAARSLGAERGTIKKFGLDKVQDAGRYALDNKLISPLGNAEKMIERNNAIQDRAGEAMGDVYKQIDDAGMSTFNPYEVAETVDKDLGGFWRSPINKGETKQLDNMLESILMRSEGLPSEIPLREAQTLKQEIAKVANWKNNLAPTDKEKMAREAYGIVSSAIDDVTELGAITIGKEELSGQLKQAKDLFSKSKTAESLLENKFARERGNKFIGLTDTITGAGGYTGGASVSAAAIAAKKGLERFGANNAALGADKIGDMLKSSPEMLGKFSGVLQQAAQRGPTALGATHFILESQNPEYQKMINKLKNEDE